MSKLTKRITAILLAGMLVIGSVPGSVFATSTDVDPGQTSEIAQEVYEEESSEAPAGEGETGEIEETSEVPMGAGETAESEETSETPADAAESPSEAASAEEAQYYTVTLDANGGYFENEWDDAIGDYAHQAEVVEKHIPVNGTVTAFPVFIDQDGQTMLFAGWSLERDGELVTMGDEEYAPVDNCVLYAVWQVVESEDAALAETEGQEVAEENIEQVDAVQDSEEVENASKETVTAEEGTAEEDTASEANTDPETENGQTVASSQEAVYEVAENISEESSDAVVSVEEAQPELIESSEEEETVREDAANGVVASGECGVNGDNLTWTLDEEGTLTISGTGEMEDYGNKTSIFKDFTIKNAVITDGVTSIGNYAFQQCEKLTSVIIPEGITRIGDYAFYSCYDLISVTIPEGVTSIGNGAFDSCLNLTHVTIPESVTSIGMYAFDNCFKLASVTIPEGVKKIEKYTFHCCAIESITIPKGVTSIGDSALRGCKNLTSVVIPEGVTNIGDNVFYDCSSLTSITIPEGVKRIGDFLFRDCKNLASVTIPEGVTSLGKYAFLRCISLNSITIPNSVTSIGVYAFEGCSSLKSITIPEGVTSIDNQFLDCSNLTSITIPNSVTSIGNNSFDTCHDITIKGFTNSEAYRYAVDHRIPFIAVDTILNPVLVQGTTENGLTWGIDSAYVLIIEGNGEIADYSNMEECPWSSNNYFYDIRGVFVGPDITYIGNAFNNYEKLIEVTLCEGVEIIGQGAFKNCENLASVMLPSTLERINSNAFRGCSKLSSITIPGSVTTIGGSAFYGCSKLSSITIPGSVTTIGGSAFYGCDSLVDITISEGVTVIGYSAFRDCSKLSSITIPSSVTTIGGSAFYGCDSLVDITISEGVTVIDSSAFYGCSKLSSITIPGSVTTIRDRAFYGCDSLVDITISEGVKNIENYAFADCSNLTSITIPESVVYFGSHAFYNCIKISNVTIQSAWVGDECEEKYLGENAFYYYNSRLEQSEPIPGLTIHGYSGTATEYYAKRENIPFNSLSTSISGAEIEVPSQTYNGNALQPTVSVELDGTKLKQNTDYTVVYRNNINAGTATVTITGKAKYIGTKEQDFSINKAPQSITAPNLSLTFPNSGKITTSGNKGSLSYKSSNTAIATVDSTGKVTAKGAGKATITITAAATNNYNAATKTITVTVAKAAQSITAKAAVSSVAVGKTTTVSITGNKGSKSFKSSDTTVATVSSTGVVTAKKVGTVKITATSAATSNYNAASKTVTIKVVPAATASLTAANQATGIKLTWKKVTGANGYKVYRGSTLIKTITSGSTVTFADTAANTNGTKYNYKIVAKASTGDSTLSKSVAVYRVARPTISSATNSAASKMTVKWGKNAKANGYQIQYSLSSSFASGNKAVSITSASTVSKVIGSLTKGKTYYIRIRTYKTVGSTKYWSEWSAKKSVKISK